MKKVLQNVLKLFAIILSLCLAQCVTTGTAKPGKPSSIQIIQNEKAVIKKDAPFPFDSVFMIQLVSSAGDRYLSGTAWVISPAFSKTIFDGFPVVMFMTAGHVCQGIEQIKPALPNSKIVISTPFLKKQYTVDTMFYSNDIDLCIAYSETQMDESLTGFTIRMTDVIPMEKVFSVQGPYAVFPLVFSGNVSYHNNLSGIIVIGIIAHPGSSGSPVFDENGEVIGVVSKVHIKGTGITIAVDNNAMILFLTSFVHKYVAEKEAEKSMISYDVFGIPDCTSSNQ